MTRGKPKHTKRETVRARKQASDTPTSQAARLLLRTFPQSRLTNLVVASGKVNKVRAKAKELTRKLLLFTLANVLHKTVPVIEACKTKTARTKHLNAALNFVSKSSTATFFGVWEKSNPKFFSATAGPWRRPRKHTITLDKDKSKSQENPTVF